MQGSRIKFLDRLIVLFFSINLTGSYIWIAGYFETSVSQVSLYILSTLFVYCIVNIRELGRALRSIYCIYALCLFCVWPLIRYLISDTNELEIAGDYLYLGLHIIAGSIFVQKKGRKGILTVCTIAFAISVFGLIMSLVYPGFFDSSSVVAIAKREGGAFVSEYEVGGRAFGFFLQPNRLAENIVLLATFINLCLLTDFKLRFFVAYPCLIGLIFATGSRGGFLQLVCSILFIEGYLFAKSLNKSGLQKNFLKLKVNKFTIHWVPISIMIIISGLLAVIFFLQSGSSRIETFSDASHFINSFKSENTLARIDSQKAYLDYVRVKPMAGYGLGANGEYINIGLLPHRSHNAFIEEAFTFGIPYSACILLFLLFLIGVNIKRVLNFGGRMLLLYMSAFIFLTCFISNTVLHDRPFMLALGMAIGLVYLPGNLSTKQKNYCERMSDPAVFDYSEGTKMAKNYSSLMTLVVFSLFSLKMIIII